MIRSLWLFVMILSISGFAHAQNQEVVILSASGEAKYRSAGEKEWKKLPVGKTIPLNSTISVPDKQTAIEVLFKQMGIELKNKKKFKIARFFSDADPVPMPAFRSFEEEVMGFASSGKSGKKKDEDDDETEGFGHLSALSEPILGFASSGKSGKKKDEDDDETEGMINMAFKIEPINPLEGQIINNVTTFEWVTGNEASPEAPAFFEFNIVRSSDNAKILTAQSKEPRITVDLRELNLQKSEEYFWEVTNTVDKISKVFFNIDDGKKLEEDMMKLRQNSSFLKAGPIQKQLLKAHMAERLDYSAEANAIYRDLIQKESSPVAAIMYKNFLRRLARKAN